MRFGPLKDIVQTLRFRLTAWVAIIVCLVVVITMMLVRGVMVRAIYSEFDQRLIQDMVEVRLILKDFYPETEPFYQSMARRSMSHPHVDWFVQLFDLNNN